LVLLSHGTGGAAAQLSWLAESLATHGYMVAGVNHHGNTAAEPTYHPHGFTLWWERPRDLSVLLDQLLADPVFSPHIDPERVGALGFSLGGYSVLALAGARVDHDAWKTHCKTESDPGCRLPPELPFTEADVNAISHGNPIYLSSLSRAGHSYADRRIQAVVALAPVLGFALEPKSVAEIDVPVLVRVGADDDQALPAAVKSLANAISTAEMRVYGGVGHYSFLALCTLRGRLFVRDLCGEPGGTDRRELHQRVADDARRFFDRHLGKPPE
jgi:predicted dienelactone hydrolase